MKRRLIVLTLLMAMTPALCWAGDVVVIVNPSVPESTLSAKEIKDIYLGKKTSWGNGSKINFVVLNGDTHDTFLSTFVKKTAAQFNTFWKKQVFTGKGSPPQAFDSNQAMIDFVSRTPGAIGYVSGSADVSNVKTITVQ